MNEPDWMALYFVCAALWAFYASTKSIKLGAGLLKAFASAGLNALLFPVAIGVAWIRELDEIDTTSEPQSPNPPVGVPITATPSKMTAKPKPPEGVPVPATQPGKRSAA